MSNSHEIFLTKGNVPLNTAEPITGSVKISMTNPKKVKCVDLTLKGVVETGWNSNDNYVSYSGTCLKYTSNQI